MLSTEFRPVGTRPTDDEMTCNMRWHRSVLVGLISWDGTAWKCSCGKRWAEGLGI